MTTCPDGVSGCTDLHLTIAQTVQGFAPPTTVQTCTDVS